MSNLPDSHKINVPSWLPWVYGSSIIWLIPWIVYLAYTLPPKQTMANWCPVWVGFDIIMILIVSIIIYLALKKSPWLSFPLVALATMLLADAWFDTMTANGNLEITTSLLMAALGEIPWALFSIWCAVRVQRQTIAKTDKVRR